MKQRPIERAKEALLEDCTQSNARIAEALGISARTVSYARAQLVDAGKIMPANFDRTRRVVAAPVKVDPDAIMQKIADENTPFDTLTTADLNRVVDKATQRGDSIDEEEIDINRLKRILWRIARTDPDNRIRTTAIWTLTRIQQEADSRPLGPGQPLTKAGAIDRLVMLFRAVGPEVVLEAVHAWSGKGTNGEQDQQTPSAGGTQDDAGTSDHEGTQAEAQESVC